MSPKIVGLGKLARPSGTLGASKPMQVLLVPDM